MYENIKMELLEIILRRRQENEGNVERVNVI
jgi:hypothetical protein